VSEPSYTIAGGAITCHRCGHTSYNPTDVAQRYCGHCTLFHEDVAELLAERTALRARLDTLESIIQGAGQQLGQGEIPLPVAIAQLHIACRDAQRRAEKAEACAAALLAELEAAQVSHVDAWRLVGRCEIALELVEAAKTIRGARARAREMRDAIKKASEL
jgi:hypothetical protein